MKHRILALRENTSGGMAWVEIEGNSPEEIYLSVGQFIAQALQAFYDRLSECDDSTPDLELLPKILSQAEYDTLVKETWLSEARELIRSVECGASS